MPAARSQAQAAAPADLAPLIEAAVTGVGGTQRPGQVQMAQAVASAVEPAAEHLLVQAGTGTGKSLAYLVPAMAHAVATRRPVVVATATLALQAQVVDRDLPRITEALAPLLGRRATFGLVKGRRNYLCQHKLVGGFPEEEDDALFGTPVLTSRLGDEVLRLRELGEGDGVRRPRRAGARGVRAGLASGLGVRARVPGRQVPDARGVLRRAGARRPPRCPTWWSPTTRCWPSTPSRDARSCPSTTWSSSTRGTSWSTG